MRALFACGGTAGHINPALAVARNLQKTDASAAILFAGATGGMETELVPREGFSIQTVTVDRLRHALTPAALLHNLRVLRQMPASLREAKAIIENFCPDVVVGMGGYASYPFVRRADTMDIPTAIHESNAVPGFTTRLLARHVDQVMVSFEDSAAQYKQARKIAVTGTPVRGALFEQNRQEARRSLGVDDRPLVVSFFGSLGARDMNTAMLDYLPLCAKEGRFAHIHAAGKNRYEDFIRRARDKNLCALTHIQIQDYIFDMPKILTAADLVITRAGASTLAEICALQKPAILVPSPNVAGNHQDKNARMLERHGAAMVIPEAHCTGETLYKAVVSLLENQAALSHMRHALGQLSTLDSTDKITQILRDLSQNKPTSR